jgi:hypothetical protein
VLYGTNNDISEVIVNGRILKKNKKLITVDLASTLPKAQERVEEIIGMFFNDYPEQRINWNNKVITS